MSKNTSKKAIENASPISAPDTVKDIPVSEIVEVEVKNIPTDVVNAPAPAPEEEKEKFFIVDMSEMRKTQVTDKTPVVEDLKEKTADYNIAVATGNPLLIKVAKTALDNAKELTVWTIANAYWDRVNGIAKENNVPFTVVSSRFPFMSSVKVSKTGKISIEQSATVPLNMVADMKRSNAYSDLINMYEEFKKLAVGFVAGSADMPSMKSYKKLINDFVTNNVDGRPDAKLHAVNGDVEKLRQVFLKFGNGEHIAELKPAKQEDFEKELVRVIYRMVHHQTYHVAEKKDINNIAKA